MESKQKHVVDMKWFKTFKTYTLTQLSKHMENIFSRSSKSAQQSRTMNALIMLNPSSHLAKQKEETEHSHLEINERSLNINTKNCKSQRQHVVHNAMSPQKRDLYFTNLLASLLKRHCQQSS